MLEFLHFSCFLGLFLHLSREGSLGLFGRDEVFLGLVAGGKLLQDGPSIGGLESSVSGSFLGLLSHFGHHGLEVVRWISRLLPILLVEEASPLLSWLVMHIVNSVFDVFLLIEVVDVSWVNIQARTWGEDLLGGDNSD